MSTPSNNRVRFLLDGRFTEIDFQDHPELKPSTTVLNYLRSLPNHHGVREGCGEGDCGACTVVLASPGTDGRLSYMAVDSCLLFLPMIHGRQLITVENLAQRSPDGIRLHPVQQNLVTHYGSQCGYCTPGIVMSMFALYKNNPGSAAEEMIRSLSGNLCRCTGYQPILEAAKAACQARFRDHFDLQEQETLKMLEQINASRETLSLTGQGQKYLKPFTLAEALRLRNAHPEAVVTSGSTDIALRQTKNRELLQVILDISDVAGLDDIKEDEKAWHLGALASVETIRKVLQDRLPSLAEILEVFGSLQIRNLATLGGNIGSASPIGDTLPLLMAMNASVSLQSFNGIRTISVENFITGYRSTDLHADELITSIMIPKPEAGTIIRTYKVSKRRETDISTVSAAFSLLTREGMVNKISVVFGGMASRPARAAAAELYLTGRPWSRESVTEAMAILESSFDPISDARSGAEYRRIVCKNLLMKFFLHTC